MNGFFNQFNSWVIAISDGKPHVKCIVLDFLVAQWLRICLPVQGPQVWSLAHDPWIRGATTFLRHSF